MDSVTSFLNSNTNVLVPVMSIFMILGGGLGFLLKGSKISLFSGVISGGLYAYVSYLLHTNVAAQVKLGAQIGFVESLLLATVFTIRFIKGRKAMAAVITTFCLITAAALNDKAGLLQ